MREDVGERGPKGDHGQHGDAGRRGETGDPGRTGAMGDQGIAGERGPTGDIGATGPAGAEGEAGKSSRLTEHITASFVALTLIFLAILIFLAYQVHVNRNLAHQGRDAHDSLCVIRGNLERRLADGEKLLSDNPGEDPIHDFGLTLPRDQVIQSVGNQRNDLRALDRLDCVPPPKTVP